MEENRNSPRYLVHWRSAVTTEDGDGPVTVQCKTNDVSSSGVSVICERSIPVSQVVTVHLLIHPGDQNHQQQVVEAHGIIRNNSYSGQEEGFRLGIQFLKFAGDGMKLLLKHLPKESAPGFAPPPPAAAQPPAAAPVLAPVPAPDKRQPQ